MQGFFRQEKQPSPSGATMNNTRQELEKLLENITIHSAVTEFERLCANQVEAEAAELVLLFASPNASTIRLYEMTPTFALNSAEIKYLTKVACWIFNKLPQELSLKKALLLYLSPKQATTNVPLRGELSRLTAFVSELPEQRLVSLFGLTP